MEQTAPGSITSRRVPVGRAGTLAALLRRPAIRDRDPEEDNHG
jgi:hypothetical protein